jgi:hypothetical protein
MEIVIKGYQQDKQCKTLLTKLILTGSNNKGFTLQEGIIRYKGRIWLGNHKEAHQAVLLALHASGIGGHSGQAATYNKVKSLFAWPGLKKSVQEYVTKCEVCLKAKPEHTKLPRLLHPLPIPTQAWDIISMDFVEGLPKSKNKDTILVVIDKFTKYAHFLPLSHPYTAMSIAHIFHNEFYKLHGLPSTIISDRDKVFTSSLWQELFKLSETTLNMSSAYHPQTDGQTERLNQCLETYLRCMTHACPSKWMNWLALAEFWYNTTTHSAHGKTPFEVLYGHQPRHFGISADSHCTTEDLEQWLQDRKAMQVVIQHNLSRAQN